jgi:hypothetical protein
MCVCCVLFIVLLLVGSHGGARDGNRIMTIQMQTIVEYHAWQILQYDPK